MLTVSSAVQNLPLFFSMLHTLVRAAQCLIPEYMQKDLSEDDPVSVGCVLNTVLLSVFVCVLCKRDSPNVETFIPMCS